jgi:hypothetical protein
MELQIHTEQAEIDPQRISQIEQEKEEPGGSNDTYDQQVIDPDKVATIEDEKKRRRSGGASSSW